MKVNLRRLAQAAGASLLETYGFVLKGTRFTRQDELARSVWFVPMGGSRALYPFDVLLHVGPVGLSAVKDPAVQQEWIVGASLKQVLLRTTPPPRKQLAFVDGAYDPSLEEYTIAAL